VVWFAAMVRYQGILRVLIGITALIEAGCGSGGSPMESPCSACSPPGSIAGVSVCVSASTCVYEQGKGGTFKYEVTVGPDAPLLHIEATTGCSFCGQFSSEPLSFINYAITGDGAQYCLCDTGCCPPKVAQEITLKQGKFEGSFDWPGKQWSGPSDTGNPLGAPFPPGSYTVAVTFSGAAEGAVAANLPIQVVSP
jgi:hypothetical protein